MLLNAKDLAKSFNPNQPGNYGYGWFINQVNMQGQAAALLIADHTGSIDGFGAYMARVLNDSSFIVVLKNQRADTYIDPAYAPEIGRQILSVLYGNQVIPPKKSIARHIACKIGNQCVDSALAEYYRIAASHSGQFNMEEPELNKLGIELYFRFNRMDDALQVLRVNMEQFPQSYNTYDSYAYLLMQKGDHENAVQYYKKGLEVLTKYPQANEGESVKKDAEKARAYIRKMEGGR
jgi:tetratricopeptide (TPR) repeat protein